MQRRQFLQASTILGLASTGIISVSTSAALINEAFVQPPLPYSLDSLKPFLSEEQMNYHYNKHHAGYFANLKKLLDGQPEAGLPLPEIIVTTKTAAVFNNAAQAWNHSFFWNCLAPTGQGGQPSEKLAVAINRDFESLDKFQEQFIAKGTAIFGSGWCWLAADQNGTLEILPLSNADNPLKYNKIPLLVADVWEHAYYIDYRNERGRFLKTFINYINWNFVNKNYL